MNVVSFSLYGDNPTYTEGAIKNAKLVNTMYPGFHSWFYVGDSVPWLIVSRLEALRGTRVIRMAGQPEDYTSTFWRFQAASSPEVDVMLSRDVDGRIEPREVAAVQEYLDSPYDWHFMRDHPWHDVPILAGLFGVRGESKQFLNSALKVYRPANHYQTDQNFLGSLIYPFARLNAMIHDEYFQFESDMPQIVHKFPTPRVGGGFVGQGYDGKDDLLYPEHQWGQR